jgi:lipoprotein-anchoring transpeptidase ErfK/SrfK
VSAGEINGRPSANLTHAIAAWQGAHSLPATGEANCDTWNALSAAAAGPSLLAYRITEDDARGPFTATIPAELVKQAALPALGYTSAIERLAERFHTSPAALKSFNRGKRFVAGVEIQVPNVQAFNPDTRPAFEPTASDAIVTVSRDDSSLRVTKPDGSLVFFAPVTTGSVHDPLPTGDWKVTTIDWLPPFHYNPALFWDAKGTDAKATIKPGPNNPVGVVWIGLNLEHYGIHGTPEPGRIGHTESHGCVRLTNWDAARVTALVKPDTPVLFR